MSVWAVLPETARADGRLDSLLSRVAKEREGLRALRGPFAQTRSIGLLSTDIRSHGRLTLLRPDRLRWELLAPDQVIFWVGPEGLAYQSAHGGGALPRTGSRFAVALDDVRTLLGGDLTKLTERWALRVIRDDASGAEIEASPQGGPQAGISSMRLALARDLVRPTHITLIEGPRDRTVIDFEDLTINPAVELAEVRPPSR